jgi:GNAT superfamily N-acetyltransferase
MNPNMIRRMKADGLSGVAELAGQWGYPSTREQIERRFRDIPAGNDHALLVAAAEDGGMAGWIHVHPLHSLESDSCAEIGGLIVDGRRRRQGAGRALVGEAERWARARGFRKIRVRSNIVRTEAHRFYPALGFALNKTARLRPGPLITSRAMPGAS